MMNIWEDITQNHGERMSKKIKTLFVTEKWCDANPDKGLTNNYHNLFKTYNNAIPDSQFDIVHFDEYSMIKKKHIDEFLINLIEKKKPDVVIFSLMDLDADDYVEIYSRVQQASGTPTIQGHSGRTTFFGANKIIT